jgi:hypothetical protein
VFSSHHQRTFQKPEDIAKFNPDTFTEALFA